MSVGEYGVEEDIWDSEEWRNRGVGEVYIMRSFMIGTPHQILFGRWNQEELYGQGMWHAW